MKKLIVRVNFNFSLACEGDKVLLSWLAVCLLLMFLSILHYISKKCNNDVLLSRNIGAS